MPDPEVEDERGIHMISKAEALQKLKKMGMMVADDASIVTVLLPTGISFETGLKDVKTKLKELGYESSFCVKQSKDAVIQQESAGLVMQDDAEEEFAQEVKEEEKLTEEEISSYMALDTDGQFALDDDGQFSLGLEF